MPDLEYDLHKPFFPQWDPLVPMINVGDYVQTPVICTEFVYVDVHLALV